MNTSSIILIVIGILIIALIGWVTIGSNKRRWYKVYLANNDVKLLYRDLNERWWRTSDRYMRFKDERGQEVTFPSNAHWVIMWESVSEAELPKVREEIIRIQEVRAKEIN